MNSPILFQAGIPILFILVCVAVYQLRRRWNAWHLVFAVLLFLMSVLFMGFAALSLKTRNWLEYHDDLAARLKASQAQAELLLYGDPSQVEQDPTVTDLRAALTRTILDRGRVWRDCTPTDVAADFTLSVTTTPPGMDPAAAPKNGIDVKDVLYVFQELDVDGSGVKAPVLYMGEFRVEAQTDQTVTLKPLLPLDAAQQAQLQARQGTWALYEIMPIDSHLAFAEDPEFQPDLEDANAPLFGQWDPERLRGFFNPSIQLYQQEMGAQLPPDFAAQPMREWLPTPGHPMQDGYLLTPEQIDSGGAEVDENTWVKVRFLKNWTLPADEVNDPAQSGLSSSYYSARGRAVIDFLRRKDGDYTFTKDQIALFRKVPEGQTVQPEDDILNRLLSDGTAEQIAPYYIRPLVDFDRAYHTVVIQKAKLQLQDDEIARAIALARTDQQSTLKQIAAGQTEKANLTKERDLFFAERDQITQYSDDLNQKVASLRQQLNQLARENAQLAAELTRLQSAATGVAAN